MCFETALVLALLSGRSLVTPKVYRFQNEPEWDQGRFRPLHPQEFLDLGALRSTVEVISCEEYERRLGGRTGDRADLSFEPGTAVFCYPAIPANDSVEGARLRHFAAGRNYLLELTAQMRACRTLHLKSATLEHFYSFFYLWRGQKSQHLKRVVRDQVRFKAETIGAASRIARALGVYGAAHIRRNDFLQQQTDQNIPTERLLGNLLARIPRGARLYIATDEPDKSFFSVIRNHYEIYFLEDCKSVIDPCMPEALLACVEQMVCAFAALFLGTRLSTFSAYISRLRGYYGAPDSNVYFTDGSPGSEMDDVGSPLFSWTNWLRAGNPLWGREFKEGWELSQL
jgi:hypothetical protein